MNNWKYNKETNEVWEAIFENSSEIVGRKLLVIGKADWADGEELEDGIHFEIKSNRGELLSSIHEKLLGLPKDMDLVAIPNNDEWSSKYTGQTADHQTIVADKEIELPDDLHKQVMDHIRNYKHFDWDEALSGNEMSLLEDMLMTFNPLCPPGSAGFEEQKRHIERLFHPSPPIEDIKDIRVEDKGEKSNPVIAGLEKQIQGLYNAKYKILESGEPNDLFRSFYAICEREGKDTNWPAITERIRIILELQQQYTSPNIPLVKEGEEAKNKFKEIYLELAGELGKLLNNKDFNTPNRLKGYEDALWDLKIIIQDKCNISLSTFTINDLKTQKP